LTSHSWESILKKLTLNSLAGRGGILEFFSPKRAKICQEYFERGRKREREGGGGGEISGYIIF